MGEYAMKKLAFILISTALLVIALACEVIPLFMILWETRGSDVTSGGRGWIVVGVLLATFFVLFLIDVITPKHRAYPAKVIKLDYTREGCDEVIMHYAGVADARKTCRNLGANIELVTPSGFDAAKLDYDARLNLEWLKHNGAKNGITITKGGE